MGRFLLIAISIQITVKSYIAIPFRTMLFVGTDSHNFTVFYIPRETLFIIKFVMKAQGLIPYF